MLLTRKFIIEANRLRRNLMPIQKLELDLKLAELYGEEAKEKQRATIPEKGEKGFQPVLVQNCTSIKPIAIFLLCLLT